MKFPNLYRFKINKKLGERFAYTIYKAVDATNGNEVVLRVLKKSLAEEQSNVLRFLTSARMLKLLDNPGMCEIYDYGNDQGNFYVSSEMLTDWVPISTLISEPPCVSVSDLIDIFIKVGISLRQAHLRGITHGILNPKKIYINSEGQIKIDAFGFSWAVPELFKTPTRHSIDMAQYISPDFYTPKSKMDGRVDIYSLGTIMFHVLTGRPLYEGSTFEELQTKHLEADLPLDRLSTLKIPEDLKNTVIRAIDLKSDNGFLNLKEFVAYLEKAKDGLSTASESEPSVVNQEVEEEAASENTEKYFVDQDGMEAPRKGFFRSRGLVASVSAIAIAFSIVFFGKDKLNSNLLIGLAKSDSSAQVTPTTDMSPGVIPAKDSKTESGADDWISAIEKEVEELTQRTALKKKEQTYQDSFGPAKIQPKRSATIKGSGSKKTQSASKQNSKPKTARIAKSDVAKNDKTKARKPDARKRQVAKNSKPKKSVLKNSKTAKQTSASFVVKSDKDPSGAAVFVNNQFKGKTDNKGRFEMAALEVGKSYTVKISKNGYKTVTQKFKASVSKPILNLELKPKRDIFGSLVLDASPGADSIYVDDKLYKGKMPLNLTLPWGEHRVRFVNARLKKDWEQVVHLKVGQILRVKHDFAKAEVGKVAVSLKNAANFGFGYVYVDGKIWQGTPNTTPLELELPVGSHTIEIRREGFNAVPKDIIVVVEKNETKFVSFSFSKDLTHKTD
ncbi:protein kinase [bacterium]|nr:protein kinase [bacterium]